MKKFSFISPRFIIVTAIAVMVVFSVVNALTKEEKEIKVFEYNSQTIDLNL